MNSIKENYKDLTIILIAHRLNTVVDCDNIFVINNGKITEEGTHSSLISINGGVYQRMFNAE